MEEEDSYTGSENSESPPAEETPNSRPIRKSPLHLYMSEIRENEQSTYIEDQRPEAEFKCASNIG